MKFVAFILSFLLFSFISFAQLDTSFIVKLKALDTLNSLKNDTVAVPDDQLTKKIKSIRSQRKGLTTETVVKMKILEQQEKDNSHSKEFYKQLLDEVTTGKTSKLIENSLINLYRRTFTKKELNQLTRFYKTSAGKKMDKEFILLMLQSVKNAEQLLKLAIADIESKKVIVQ
jgi:hypothetical protein